jgi:hypothetical protein
MKLTLFIFFALALVGFVMGMDGNHHRGKQIMQEQWDPRIDTSSSYSIDTESSEPTVIPENPRRRKKRTEEQHRNEMISQRARRAKKREMGQNPEKAFIRPEDRLGRVHEKYQHLTAEQRSKLRRKFLSLGFGESAPEEVRGVPLNVLDTAHKIRKGKDKNFYLNMSRRQDRLASIQHSIGRAEVIHEEGLQDDEQVI